MSLFGCVFLTETIPQEKSMLDDRINSLPFGFSEVQRLKSMKNKDSARQSLGGWTALERIMEELSLSRDLTVLRTDMGKPYFREVDLPAFSISHSGMLAVAVLNENGSVGADVELVRPNTNLSGIAARFFSSSEQKALAESKNPEECFYRIWTHKEAYAKMTGDGLSSIFGKEIINSEGTAQVFRLCYREAIAYLTVISEQVSEPIQWINYNKELTIDELQNGT